MNLFLFLYLQLFSVSMGFIRWSSLSSNFQNKIMEFHHCLYNKQELFQKNYQQFIEITHEKTGYFIVKSISSLLPHVDSIGHKVLHANDVYISRVLNFDNMPHDVKREIILCIIKISQWGDDFGSHLLQLYYDIVDKCLH